MPPDIPGFWYDEERGKYFKIFPNNVAPKGAKYSKEGVEKEKKAQQVALTISFSGANYLSSTSNHGLYVGKGCF